MTQGRTIQWFERVYVGGYDLSSDTTKTGDLECNYEAPSEGALGWAVKGALCGQAMHAIGDVNALLRTTSTTLGIHDLFPALQGTSPHVMIPLGIQAAPAMGDPTYAGRFALDAYTGALGTNMLACNLKFGQPFPGLWASYSKPWGQLVHAAGNETAVNSGTGLNDNGAATALGGWMAWQIFGYTGTGSVVITVQDSADNATGWAAITGATSGSIAHTAMPQGGLVFLGTTQAVRQYLRWQIALTTLTGINFALAFGRSIVQGV